MRNNTIKWNARESERERERERQIYLFIQANDMRCIIRSEHKRRIKLEEREKAINIM